ncbi:hypothetical protein SEA_TWISTER6_81 [Gordonia phage Twister6]|uniref:Uncharacterized protein n=3 Tax=Wizardvirus TaxID=2169658 RepID=A0A6M3SZX1_9CAUD|nr:hypothetical protein BI083_gp81 [Gordonia phage Twister6]YP_010102043.1 hypothetical protein KNU53_gp81 [Gordonia phage SmokingBunny]YP_010107716.1 hypothetical protein KNV01_gp80 [Gordonia phage Evamon]UVK62402.1 hypothetical protein SEA_SALVADOR_80 [Gordonia phage Salvador]WAA20298.1 hypothetical protein SEA_TOGO_80 [Gordonia phage Togo]AOE44990.1 hypothetical protein SEA_TWISTER6_81 [Gordonia phage Twister6]QCG77892.1 hypothetical protein SEA_SMOKINGBUNNY_81 [Gordonia phage SmokingBunny
MTAPKRYRKKPVEIEAIEYLGTNDPSVAEWCGGTLIALGQGFWKIEISTLEGPVTASPGDWIIRGVKGEFYPCKPDIFAETYDDPEDVDPLLAVRRAEQRLVEARQDLARANEAPKT